MPPSPVPESQLRSLAQEACTSTLSTATQYSHGQTPAWNTAIINKILSSLVKHTAASSSSSSSAGEGGAAAAAATQYKYAVNSTIIQHLDAAPSYSSSAAGTSTSTGAGAETQTASPPTTPAPESAGEAISEGSAAAVRPDKGRRGMHSATGAYWNNDTDGMWSFKWEGGEAHGMDVVISVIWVAV